MKTKLNILKEQLLFLQEMKEREEFKINGIINEGLQLNENIVYRYESINFIKKQISLIEADIDDIRLSSLKKLMKVK